MLCVKYDQVTLRPINKVVEKIAHENRAFSMMQRGEQDMAAQDTTLQTSAVPPQIMKLQL